VMRLPGRLSQGGFGARAPRFSRGPPNAPSNFLQYFLKEAHATDYNRKGTLQNIDKLVEGSLNNPRGQVSLFGKVVSRRTALARNKR
jgi:hypothetical protein